MPKLNKSQVYVLSLAILAFGIGLLTNIATNQIPERLKPYLSYTWPALLILIGVFVVITWRSHKSSPVGPEPEFSLKRYYDALRKRYQILDLDALTPPQKEEYLQIQLRSVFVEQNVRENPPPIELPKEILERLQSAGEILTEDLPEGIKLDDLRASGQTYYEKESRPVLDVLAGSNQHLVILGDPGAGKSTLSRYLILSLIDREGDKRIREQFVGYAPILIELRTFAILRAEAKCDTFLEYLEFLGKTEGWYLTAAGLHAQLNDGRALVLFDGLDEIFDPVDRERITNAIVGFAATYPKVRIVVTTRIIGYQRRALTSADFAHYTLQDLDESQVTTFVTQWYKLALANRPEDAAARTKRIVESFKQSASIRQLAGNPMLLTIMAIIGKHQELPRERWKLYEHATSVLIEHWDVKRHLEKLNLDAPFIAEDDKKELLRRLAYRMQAGSAGLKGNYIPAQELQAEFEGYLQERFTLPPDRAATIARHMIEQFRERNFILSLYGANIYGFVHRAFLEYFCAATFVHRFEKSRELTPDQLNTEVFGAHWQDKTWHEVLRLISGMIDERFADGVIEYLVTIANPKWPDDLKSNPPWNLALAVQCLAEIRNKNSVVHSSTSLLRAILQLLAFAGETWEKSFAVSSFVGSQLLSSVAVIGGQWPNRQLFSDLLLLPDLFAKSASVWRLSYEFAELVGMLESERTHEVIKSYAISSVASYRMLAPLALTRLRPKDTSTLELLHQAVVDEDEDVRWSAIGALLTYNDSRTLHLLANCLSTDPIPINRSAILTYLESNVTADLEGPIKERALRDPISGLRRKAITILVDSYRRDKRHDALRSLLDAVKKDEDKDVQKLVATLFVETDKVK